MKRTFRLLIALTGLAAADIALAQMPPSPNVVASKAMTVSQLRASNAALMHHYYWDTRTEILVNGQVKDIRIDQVSFGPGGQLQKQLVNDQPSSGFFLPTPIGFLRRAVADHEKEEMQQYLAGLRTLLEQYTLPTTGKIMDFLASAATTTDPATGMFVITGNNIIQPGDSLTFMINTWTMHPAQVKVSTSFQGSPVSLTASFKTLPSGLNYADFAEASAPAKNLTVQVQNYNYTRLAN